MFVDASVKRHLKGLLYVAAVTDAKLSEPKLSTKKLVEKQADALHH